MRQLNDGDLERVNMTRSHSLGCHFQIPLAEAWESGLSAIHRSGASIEPWNTVFPRQDKLVCTQIEKQDSE